MIKINLAARKKSASAGMRIDSGGGGGSRLSLDVTKFTSGLGELKELPIKKFVFGALFVIIGNMLLNGYMDDQVKLLDAELEKLNAEKPKLQAEANKMKGLEALKKNMESDEFVIRTKLETIQKLMADRGSSAKLLEELARLTPGDVWLTDVDLKAGELALKGFSLDFARVSDFMKMLEESTTFRDLTLKDTQTATDDQKREVASFQIQAKKR